MKKILFYIAVTLLWLISLLPMWLLHFIASGIYYILYYVVGYRKKVVFTNLKNSFPEKSEKEIKQIAKGFYRNLCDTMIETVALISISTKNLEKRTTYKGLEEIERFYNEGRPIIMATGHYNNWEWATTLGFLTKYTSLAAYRPMDDKNFDDLFKRIRSRFGVIPVKTKETARQMIEHLRIDKRVLLLLIADQSPSYDKIQHFSTFLGQRTPIYMGPEKLCIAFDAPLVFLTIHRVKRGKYLLEFTTLCEHPKDTQPLELTNMQLQFLEKQIRKKPESWLWTHKRWKHANKGLERNTENSEE